MPRKFYVELRDGDKDHGEDQARVLDLNADADSEFKTGEGKEIAVKMKKVEQKVKQWLRKQKTEKAENEGFMAEKRRKT